MAFDDVPAAKQTMRKRILAGREALDPGRIEAHAAGIAEQALALPELADPTTVAAYYSIDSEPGTRPLLEGLLAAGHRVLLPIVVRPGLDLDWAEVTGLDDLAEARMGLREPTGPRLGLDGIAAARIVFCPGLAVDTAGTRLGRGAGCYDRALRRAAPDALRCIVVYDHELVESVPSGPDDEPVHAVITPTRTLRLR